MRRTASLLFALAIGLTAHLASPPPAAACDCVAPMEVLEGSARDPGSSVFAATTGPTIGDEMSVLITTWYRGVLPAGPAVVEVALGDSAACGIDPLPPGRAMLFVTYTSETSRHAISGCSVMAPLDSDQGAAMSARATELYGAGLAPQSTERPAASTAEPAPAGPVPASLVDTLIGAAIPLTLVAAFTLGLIAGLALILRRRGRDDG
jgi:hypothetical protein